MTGKRPLLVGIGIGLILSSILIGFVSMSDALKPHTNLNTEPNAKLKPNSKIEAETELNPELSSNPKIDVGTKTTPDTKLELTAVTIPPGSAAQDVANILQEQGVIVDAEAFVQRIEARDVAGKIKAGEFKFEEQMSDDEIIDRLLELP